ncbi:hypothetical protein SAVIM338S_06026 [Streptomyces avidinii]
MLLQGSDFSVFRVRDAAQDPEVTPCLPTSPHVRLALPTVAQRGTQCYYLYYDLMFLRLISGLVVNIRPPRPEERARTTGRVAIPFTVGGFHCRRLALPVRHGDDQRAGRRTAGRFPRTDVAGFADEAAPRAADRWSGRARRPCRPPAPPTSPTPIARTLRPPGRPGGQVADRPAARIRRGRRGTPMSLRRQRREPFPLRARRRGKTYTDTTESAARVTDSAHAPRVLTTGVKAGAAGPPTGVTLALSRPSQEPSNCTDNGM